MRPNITIHIRYLVHFYFLNNIQIPESVNFQYLLFSIRYSNSWVRIILFVFGLFSKNELFGIWYSLNFQKRIYLVFGPYSLFVATLLSIEIKINKKIQFHFLKHSLAFIFFVNQKLWEITIPHMDDIQSQDYTFCHSNIYNFNNPDTDGKSFVVNFQTYCILSSSLFLSISLYLWEIEIELTL